MTDEWEDQIEPAPDLFRGGWCGDCPWFICGTGTGCHRCGLLDLTLQWYDAPVAACQADDESLDEWLARGSIYEEYATDD